jgi:Zn-dependent peptidase ImmA (M78 family)
MKNLANEVRNQYGITSSKINLSLLRQIYHEEGIHLDYWKYKLRKVRGAYFVIDGENYVIVNAAIKPKEPRIFTLAHELKHHLVDQEQINNGYCACQEVSWADGSPIEIGAEIFAAELIYPEDEFLDLVNNFGIGQTGCSETDVVYLKQRCPAPVSYTFIVKRLEWFNIIERGIFRKVQFKKLEEKIIGVPFYKKRRLH